MALLHNASIAIVTCIPLPVEGGKVLIAKFSRGIKRMLSNRICKLHAGYANCIAIGYAFKAGRPMLYCLWIGQGQCVSRSVVGKLPLRNAMVTTKQCYRKITWLVLELSVMSTDVHSKLTKIQIVGLETGIGINCFQSSLPEGLFTTTTTTAAFPCCCRCNPTRAYGRGLRYLIAVANIRC